MRKGGAGIVVAALLIAGCGGDSEPTSEERPEDIEDLVEPPAETLVAEPTPTAIPVEIEPEQLTYTVQEGDLMGTIAQTFDVPLGALVFVNDLDNPDFIQIGQELLIPTEDDIAEWEAAEAAAADAEPTPTEEPADSTTDDGAGGADG